MAIHAVEHFVVDEDYELFTDVSVDPDEKLALDGINAVYYVTKKGDTDLYATELFGVLRHVFGKLFAGTTMDTASGTHSTSNLLLFHPWRTRKIHQCGNGQV